MVSSEITGGGDIMENNKNLIKSVVLADYSQFVDGKHRNGGCYGYDVIYTYMPEQNGFAREWCTTCELIPDAPSGVYSLTDVLNETADFVRRHANEQDCYVSVNYTMVWESTPSENTDIDMSDCFLDD